MCLIIWVDKGKERCSVRQILNYHLDMVTVPFYSIDFCPICNICDLSLNPLKYYKQ